MKGRITHILPMPMGEKHAWAVIEVGLSPTKIVLVDTTVYRIGDELEVPHFFLGPEIDSTLEVMALELEKHGKIEWEERTDLLGECDYSATSYVVKSDLNEVDTAYLTLIFELLVRNGELVRSEHGISYTISSTEARNQARALELVELGYLLASYEWKTAHEIDALKGKSQNENQKAGLAAASLARMQQGYDTQRLVQDAALDALNEDKALETNRSALTRAVSKRLRRSEYAPPKPLSEKHIYRVLTKMGY